MAPTVGVIGVGTVGGALLAAFEGKASLRVRDPRLPSSCAMGAMVETCSVVFLCVPTPMGDDGAADLTAYHDVVTDFVDAGGVGAQAPILCVRSAVPPDAIAHTLATHQGLRLVVAPEFLRQRAAMDDTLGMRALVLGGRLEDCNEVERLFREHSHITGPMRTAPPLDAVAAAFLKYQANCFLATKVSFMNEFHDLFQEVHSTCSWEALQEAFHLDHERFGGTHWHVPGPDGRRGWGGHCLPKDVAATRAFGAAHDVPTPMLDTVWSRNEHDRES